MKYTIGAILILVTQFSYSISDKDFERIKWSYTVFEDSETDSRPFAVKSIDETISGSPFSRADLKINNPHFKCSINEPSSIYESKEIERVLECTEVNSKKFTQSIQLVCGEVSKSDKSTSYIHSQLCKENVCKNKSYKIVFSCNSSS